MQKMLWNHRFPFSATIAAIADDRQMTTMEMSINQSEAAH